MKKVQILMSTYNGEQFLKEQIESILNQEDVDISVLIRDDGSSDSTKKIIETYQKKYPEKFRIYFENNIGVKKSFLRLVELSEDDIDYFAFSDQDDVWDKDKIKCAVTHLGDDNGCPKVYASNVNIYSDARVIKGKIQYCEKLELGNFLVKSFFPGCTMVFNKKVRDLLKIVDYNGLNSYPLHDHWVCLVCSSCGGEIVFDNDAHILYRQHQQNVVGYERGVLNKLLQNGILSREQRRHHIVCELENNYKYYFDNESKVLINKAVNYTDSFTNKIRFLKEKKVSSGNFIQNIILKLLIIMKKF